MAVIPKRTKYRRPHRLPYDGLAKGNTELHFGEYGLQALEGAWKRGGKVWINIFPHLSLTKIPLETRMGKGKGQPEMWVAVVKKNKILFEIAGVSEEVAREALRLAMHKLPIKCKFVKKDGEKREN